MKIDIEKNKEKTIQQLKNTNRKGIDDLIQYLNLNGYFTCPCSATHHLNIEGGLNEHSLSFIETIKTLYQNYWTEEYKIPPETFIIVGHAHDTCKLKRYQQTPDGYKIKPDELPLGHGAKSLAITMKHIKLTPIEQLMIRWHMGPYEEGFLEKQKELEKYPEVYLTYFANHITTKLLKK